MIRNICGNCNIHYVLGRIRDIINGSCNSPNDIQIHDYLFAAHNLFLTWAPRFQNQNINQLTQNQLQNILGEFILEAHNGSWNNMQRTGMAVAHNPALGNLLQVLFNYRINNGVPDINDVTARLIQLCSHIPGHVKGMSVFLATAILFARDDKNFMVIDKPVRDCFGLGKNIMNQLNNYANVIQQSQILAQNFGLDLWFVNKAYGICQHNMSIKIWHLGYQFPAFGNSHYVRL